MILNRIKRNKYYKQLRFIYWEIRNMLKRVYYSVFGSKDYQKYIVITYARTGSNLLMSYLNSHENIEAKGEIFGRLHGKSCYKIWNDFFSMKTKKTKLAGFKIFYPHPFDTDDKDVWKFIAQDKNIKIIHLTRTNKLRTYVSAKIATKTDQWTRKTKSKIPLEQKQIEIDFGDLFNRLKIISDYENETRNKYQDHEFLEISYEDLVGNKKKAMKGIFDFLEVDERALSSSHKKQNKEELSDLILNYDDFVNAVEKSEYSYLLDLESR